MSIDFAAQIKEARKKHGMTQQQLASRLNITQQTVHNWEKGSIPGGDRLVEISRVLGINFTADKAEKPSDSFVAWNNTQCNPLAPAEKQNLSAWEDGYASGFKAAREELAKLLDAYLLTSDPGPLRARGNA